MDDSSGESELDININKVCRICLLESKYLFNIFSYSIVKGFIVTLPDMIRNCLEIELNDDNQIELPSKICGMCKQEIINFYTFKQKCKKSEKLLQRSIIKNNNKKPIRKDTKTPKTEIILLETEEEEKNDNEIVCDVDPLETPMNKKSKLNENVNKREQFNKEKKTKINSKTDVVVFSDDLSNSDVISLSNHDDASNDSSEIEFTNPEVDLQTKTCPVCYKTFDRTNNLKRHVEAHTGVVYKCRICSSIYAQQASRNRHMRSKHPDEMKLLLEKNETPFSRNDPNNLPFNIYSKKLK